MYMKSRKIKRESKIIKWSKYDKAKEKESDLLFEITVLVSYNDYNEISIQSLFSCTNM